MGIRTKPVPVLTPKQVEKFWSKVGKTSDQDACWNWLGHLDNGGYGVFYPVRQSAYKAHRVSLNLVEPPPDYTLLACHTCDNRKCCNPKHLYWGTQKRNMEDMCKKSRQNKVWGERHPEAKFSLDDIKKLKQLKGTMPQYKLAEMFGVTPPTVSKILLGQSWKKA